MCRLKAKVGDIAESKLKEFPATVFCLCEIKQFKKLTAQAVNQVNWKLHKWIKKKRVPDISHLKHWTIISFHLLTY